MPLKRTAILLLAMATLICFLAVEVRGQTTYTVTVIVQGLPPELNTNVYVDGAFNSTMSGGQTRSFTFLTSQSHIITVDFYVPDSTGINGTRYYEQETSWAFSASGSYTFTYITQYYLTIVTPYAVAKGEGWYDAGSVARAGLSSGAIEEGPGTRHVFTEWTAAATGTGLTSDEIIMNQPKTAIAKWKTQFHLTVESELPTVTELTGFGWYDEGSIAEFSAPLIVPASQDTRLRFTHWSGAYEGQSPSGTVLMDRPKLVRAHYIAQYLVTVRYDPASIPNVFNETNAGWYDANTGVQLGPAPLNIDLSSVERLRFVGWIENGVTSSDVAITILMDKPHEIILSYKTQYFLEVRSTYGQASGSGWYDIGATARIVAATVSGSWPFTYALTSWRIDPPSGQLTRQDGSWALIIDRPYVVEAVWSFDIFPVVTVFGGTAFAIIVIAGLVLVSKRGVFSGRLPTLRPARTKGGLVGPKTVCVNCGNRISKGALFCQRCGAQTRRVRPSASLEDRVYEYILKRGGVISLSKASKDLGITVEQLKEATEKLKQKGRLE